MEEKKYYNLKGILIDNQWGLGRTTVITGCKEKYLDSSKSEDSDNDE
jgi:hypothetical protein